MLCSEDDVNHICERVRNNLDGQIKISLGLLRTYCPLELQFRSLSLSLCGSTALWTLASFSSFVIYTQSVGLLGQGMSPSESCYPHTEQHKHRIDADIRASSGIRTHDPSARADEDSSCLRRRGHCDRLKSILVYLYSVPSTVYYRGD
jgi:hypothetical protein